VHLGSVSDEWNAGITSEASSQENEMAPMDVPEWDTPRIPLRSMLGTGVAAPR
jgi:hypothetical protein